MERTDLTRVLSDNSLSDHHSGAVPDGSLLDDFQQRPSAPIAWLQMTLQELDTMINLEAGWDGHDGDAPRADVIGSAKGLIQGLAERFAMQRPVISPTRIGGLLIQWERGVHELEVELVSRDAATYAFLNAEDGSGFEGCLFREESLTPVFLEAVSMIAEAS